MHKTFTTSQGRQIAYVKTGTQSPGVVFLGGFKSDMSGNKAIYLESWAQKSDRAFLRFDYSGHGQSSGKFEEGTISSWYEDARAALELLPGPKVLVGSSMGGWISLLLARDCPEQVAGLVTIAAAPDFTEDRIWHGLNEHQRQTLNQDGSLALASAYSDEPYIITRRLVDDGRENLVLRSPLHLPCPVRILHGSADSDVQPTVALNLFDHVEGPDIQMNMVKGADHRFSTPKCLALIEHSVEMVLRQTGHIE